MDIKKEIFTQPLADSIHHLKKAKSLLEIAEKLIASKIEKFESLPDSETRAYYFEEGQLVKCVDLGEMSSVEELLEELGDQVFMQMVEESTIQYCIILEDYCIISTPSSCDIHIMMEDKTEFGSMVKSIEDDSTIISIYSIDETAHISSQEENDEVVLYAKRTFVSGGERIIQEEMQIGQSGIFEGNVIHTIEYDANESSNVFGEILTKTVEDDDFIFEGEMIESLFYKGRLTYKHDRGIWVDFEPIVKDFDKFLEELPSTSLHSDNRPQIQMKITSPIFTYEGDIKYTVPHGEGKFTIDFKDTEFLERVKKLPKEKGIFDFFDLKSILIDSPNEDESLTGYEVESYFDRGSFVDQTYKITKEYHNENQILILEKGLDSTIPPNAIKAYRKLKDGIFYVENDSLQYMSENGNVEENFNVNYRLKVHTTNLKLLFSSLEGTSYELVPDNVIFNNLTGINSYRLEINDIRDTYFKEILRIADPESHLVDYVTTMFGESPQFKSILVEGDFDSNGVDFSGKIEVETFKGKTATLEGQFENLKLEGKECSIEIVDVNYELENIAYKTLIQGEFLNGKAIDFKSEYFRENLEIQSIFVGKVINDIDVLSPDLQLEGYKTTWNPSLDSKSTITGIFDQKLFPVGKYHCETEILGEDKKTVSEGIHYLPGIFDPNHNCKVSQYEGGILQHILDFEIDSEGDIIKSRRVFDSQGNVTESQKANMGQRTLISEDVFKFEAYDSADWRVEQKKMNDGMQSRGMLYNSMNMSRRIGGNLSMNKLFSWKDVHRMGKFRFMVGGGLLLLGGVVGNSNKY